MTEPQPHHPRFSIGNNFCLLPFIFTEAILDKEKAWKKQSTLPHTGLPYHCSMSTVLWAHWHNTLPLTQFTLGWYTLRSSSGSVLSGTVFRQWQVMHPKCSQLRHGNHASAKCTSNIIRKRSPTCSEWWGCHHHTNQKQTMHAAHNIPNTIHTFSEGTQKGSLCTYSALCSITCCMNPQLENITCIHTGLGLTHTQEHTAQREVCVCVCVYTTKGRKWWGQI